MTKISRCYVENEVTNSLQVTRKDDGLYDVSLATFAPENFIGEASGTLRFKDIETVYRWAKNLEAKYE